MQVRVEEDVKVIKYNKFWGQVSCVMYRYRYLAEMYLWFEHVKSISSFHPVRRCQSASFFASFCSSSARGSCLLKWPCFQFAR